MTQIRKDKISVLIWNQFVRHSDSAPPLAGTSDHCIPRDNTVIYYMRGSRMFCQREFNSATLTTGFFLVDEGREYPYIT